MCRIMHWQPEICGHIIGYGFGNLPSSSMHPVLHSDWIRCRFHGGDELRTKRHDIENLHLLMPVSNLRYLLGPGMEFVFDMLPTRKDIILRHLHSIPSGDITSWCVTPEWLCPKYYVGHDILVQHAGLHSSGNHQWWCTWHKLTQFRHYCNLIYPPSWRWGYRYCRSSTVAS